MIEVAKRTLNDITTYHIWKYRCKVLYKGANAVILTIIIASFFPLFFPFPVDCPNSKRPKNYPQI
jgi:hypothetical protein